MLLYRFYTWNFQRHRRRCLFCDIITEVKQ